jgi:hypothetical protein
MTHPSITREMFNHIVKGLENERVDVVDVAFERGDGRANLDWQSAEYLVNLVLAAALVDIEPEPMPEPEGDCIIWSRTERWWERTTDGVSSWRIVGALAPAVPLRWHDLVSIHGPLTVFRPERPELEGDHTDCWSAERHNRLVQRMEKGYVKRCNVLAKELNAAHDQQGQLKNRIIYLEDALGRQGVEAKLVAEADEAHRGGYEAAMSAKADIAPTEEECQEKPTPELGSHAPLMEGAPKFVHVRPATVGKTSFYNVGATPINEYDPAPTSDQPTYDPIHPDHRWDS